MGSPILLKKVMTVDIGKDAVHAAHRREQFGEIVTALVCLALWAYAWYLASGFPEGAQRFPRFVLLCLFGFSIIHMAKACWLVARPLPSERPGHEQTDDASPDASSKPGQRHPLRLLALIVGSVGYVLIMPRVGFIAGTTVFLVVGVCLSIGWTVKRVAAIVALVVGLYVLVEVLLDVRLPAGILL